MDFNVFPTLGSIAQKIVKLSSSQSIKDASNVMLKHDISSVLVETAQGHCIFSVEHMLTSVNQGIDSTMPLSKLNLTPISCISEHEHILAGLELLESNNCRYLATVNDELTPIGILTYSDIISAIDPAILIQKKTLGDLISRTEPVTFTGDWILEDVLSHLQKIEDSIIVIESSKPIGIITSKDIFRFISEGRDMSGPLTEYMTSPVITTPVSATIHDALIQLQTLRIKRCIVIDQDSKMIGVVTQSELVGATYGTWVDLVKNHAGELKELVSILESKTLGLEKSSLTDPLTGLGNRRMLEKRLKHEIERVHRYNAPPFSLLLIDIDYFKAINDEHGHLIGDEVLKTIAKKLIEITRTTDDVIRWGGEEFAILLPHHSIKNTVDFAYRIRSEIENAWFVNRIKVTVSIGVGQFSAVEKEKEFFERVDKALYRAKHKGRNCVEIDPP